MRIYLSGDLCKYRDMKLVQKNIYIILGAICFILGVIGAFLPILPTTPFILLSAYFLSKGSDRMYQKLISIPAFGDAIRNWNEKVSVSKKGKISCFLAISGVLIYINFYKYEYTLILKSLVSVVLTTVVIYVLTRPNE